MKLTAAVLAGGHSRRMGRDKALLPDAHHGTLLLRQLALLESLRPEDLLVSCRPDQVLELPRGIARIHDSGMQGPLAGLAALLAAARGDLLLVLAVDLGGMHAAVLQRLLEGCRPGIGAIPRTSAGPEPLAAVYPTTLRQAAQQRLEAGRDLSLRGLVEYGIHAGSLAWHDVAEADAACFANWNTPGDLPDSG